MHIPDVREVLRKNVSFNSSNTILSQCKVFIQKVLLRIHLYSYKDKKFEIIY